MAEQRRNRRIAMADDERDAFLAAQRVCRVATAGARGPHVAPLWFVWDGTALWLYSVVRSRRWADLAADPRVAVVVDDGVEYAELRGVEVTGRAAVVGEVPRVGGECAELEVPERLFGAKYAGGAAMGHDGRHGWLRVDPDTVVSWDFRKLAPG